MAPPHSYFLQYLLEILYSLRNNFPPTCEQFFDLLNKLIRDKFRMIMETEGVENSEEIFKELLEKVVLTIKERPIVEVIKKKKKNFP